MMQEASAGQHRRLLQGAKDDTKEQAVTQEASAG
jgi:hypothetical protein